MEGVLRLWEWGRVGVGMLECWSVVGWGWILVLFEWDSCGLAFIVFIRGRSLFRTIMFTRH
jgi:hypothetical protein